MVRGYLISAAFLALCLGGCATVVPASWRAVPDGEAMADAYPGFASHAGIEGRASLVCMGGIDGRLSDCRVEQVAPPGLGFDAAALRLTDRFETAPQTRDGVPTPSEVAFRVNFTLPPVDTVLSWDGPEPSVEHLALAREIAPRYAPSLRQGSGAVSLDGLDADRVEAVQTMLADIERELRPDAIEAVATAMARTVSPEDLRRLATGQRRPSRPEMNEGQLVRAGDKVKAVSLRANARLHAVYCAAYDCDDALPR